MPAGGIAFDRGGLKITYFKSVIFDNLQPAGSFGTEEPHHCTLDVIKICHQSSRESPWAICFIAGVWSQNTYCNLRFKDFACY